MPLTLYVQPQLTLLSRPEFLPPAHLPVNWVGTASDGERLTEFAGRLCYLSFHNPAGRTNAAYLAHILESGHGSVTEHANYSVLAEGVSRSLTHELIRHRAGCAYSELSQRFVDMRTQGAFVIPPALLGNPAAIEAFRLRCEQAVRDYEGEVARLEAEYGRTGEFGDDKTLRRKRAREAARAGLPSATETKIIVTGNVRAWRHILEIRGNVHADAEIRRFARAAHQLLVAEAPNFFGDFALDHEQSLVPRYHKV